MGINAAKATGTPRKALPALPAGAYPGRLAQVIDLGLQNQRPFKGQEKKPAYEILLTYELSDEFMLDEDGQEMKDKPRWYSENFVLYNLEAAKAKSTERYNALDPDNVHGGDFARLIGSPCNVALSKEKNKKGIDKNYVMGITPMREKDAAKLSPLVSPAAVFDLDEPDMEAFQKFQPWLKEKITTNLEYEGSKLAALLKEVGTTEPSKSNAVESTAAALDDDLPY